MLTIWFTAAAVVATATFITKTVIDVWLALRRRKHLISALRAYLVHVRDEQRHWDNREARFDFEAAASKVEGGKDGYTPYILYDPTVGFSLQDVRREYGFLMAEDMQKIVRYITAENYVNSILESLRSEYVRSFSRERKLLVYSELEKATNDMTRRLQDASEAVEKIAAQTTIQQLRYALW